jgi:hypothetical protein
MPSPLFEASTAVGSLDSITFHEFFVAGMNDAAAAAGAVVENRFRHVIRRDHNLFTPLHVGDAAAVYRVRDRFLDVFLVAFKKALAVDRALVLGVQSPINDIRHELTPHV